MVAFFLCAVIGGLQVVLLSVVLKGALGGKMKATLISLLLKFLVYAIGFSVLYFFFMQSIYYAAAGFVAGVVVSVVFVAVKTRKDNSAVAKKGDDVNEHGRAD